MRDSFWRAMPETRIIKRYANRKLYDTENDPGELTDVAQQNLDKVEELWQVLENEGGGTLPMFGKLAVLGG